MSQAAGVEPAALVVVLVVRLPASGIAGFHRYERAVLPLLGEHGGRLQRRLRSQDGRVEVHLVGFGSAKDFAAYRHDPRRARYRNVLERSGAQTELFELTDAPIQELLS